MNNQMDFYQICAKLMLSFEGTKKVQNNVLCIGPYKFDRTNPKAYDRFPAGQSFSIHKKVAVD